MKRGEKRNSDEDAFDRRKWINNFIKHKEKANQIKKNQSQGHRDPCGKGKNWKEICPICQGHSG